jgi:tetraacyldisaccharide 4'-kinase
LKAVFKNMNIKYLLFPFAYAYAGAAAFARWAYKVGLCKIHQFERPFILKIGNLSAGGTGKTPHTSFMVSFLEQKGYKVAIASRGYGRQTKGCLEVSANADPKSVGDEPLMLKKIHPDTPVYVAERRVTAVQALMQKYPLTQVLILDDAMQHWALEADYTLLLTAWNAPFFEDFPLPMGYLREHKSGYKRADMLIATQTNPVLESVDKQSFIGKISPFPHQEILFSYYNYEPAYRLAMPADSLDWQMLKRFKVLVLLGIARTEYLAQFLEAYTDSFQLIKYPDHHTFTEKELQTTIEIFKKGDYDIILSTEKDAMRLEPYTDLFAQAQVPIFILPIRVQFHETAAEQAQVFGKILNKIQNSGKI